MRARSLVFVAVCVATFAAHAAPSHAVCIWPGITHDGRIFDTVYGAEGLKVGAELGTPARYPVCNDTPADDGPPPPSHVDVAVKRVKGVDPRIAIVLESRYVLVNLATFPALPSHPLHKMFRTSIAEKRRTITGDPCQVVGIATGRSNHGLAVKVGEPERFVFVSVRENTKVELQRFGTAYIPPGTRVRVGASACSFTDERSEVVARRIARA